MSQNYDGPRTPYGDAYHGYWIQDATQLNSKFGTVDDLKALTKEVHKRGMYIMVDVVVNNVMAASTTPDYTKYMFKDASDYHPYCGVQWGNRTSEMDCWLGDTNVTLPDLRTEKPAVQTKYQDWIKGMVQQYYFDGLRIDAAKHVDSTFWNGFCKAAGIFCMGEIFGDDVVLPSQYVGDKGMDSVLNYPMYNALVETFAIPGPANVSAIVDVMNQTSKLFKDPTVLGNFLENQDNPRWANLSVDPQSLYNAMSYNFMPDGIPIVYYGQEHGFHGGFDPYNREPLWPSKYDNSSSTYHLIQKLNQLRNHLVNSSDWATQPATILTTSPQGIALMKGPVLSMLTTIGSPPQPVSLASYTPWKSSVATTDVLTCTQYAVGSEGTINVEYSKGGRPVILVPNSVLAGSGICTDQVELSLGHSIGNNAKVNGGRSSTSSTSISVFVILAGMTAIASWLA